MARWMGWRRACAASGRRLRLAQRGQMQQNLAFAFAVAAVLIVVFVIFVHQ